MYKGGNMTLKTPDWSNRTDRQLYDELFYKKNHDELTEEEQSFVTTMYHLEEFACGLDG